MIPFSTTGKLGTGPANKLLDWYEANKRDLPWRRTSDPYAIWISEVMLQQTRVDTVIPYYEKFLKQFPNLETLADSTLDGVLKKWEGLGYYSRARNLHSACREVRAKYDGKLPRNSKELLALPGFGPYTSAAVASIAFGEPVPVLDGNVWRVFSRLLCLTGTIEKNRKELLNFLGKMIPESEAAAFNQAIMELGALVCTPENPDCDHCPVYSHCLAFKNRSVEKFPEPPPKKLLPHKHWVALVLNHKEKILLRLRPLRGLWGGLWEFPTVPIERRESPFRAASKYLSEMNLESGELKSWEAIRHTFTHFKLTLYPFHARIAGKMPPGDSRWVSVLSNRLPMPVPHQKILRQLT